MPAIYRHDDTVLIDVEEPLATIAQLLTAARITGADLRNAHLPGADLTGADLTGADLTGADLRNAHLPGADLTGADLTGADLTHANLTGAGLTGASLIDADLTHANLTGAGLTHANLTGAGLTGADLRNARLIGADLTGADLTGADLTGADLSGANLTGASLIDADLRNANLTGASLRNANLTGANLTGANLRNANLTGANLTGADLRNASLIDADLTGAVLRNANLRNAGLTSANLRNANLRNANLTGAGLTGANLTGADLAGADLTGADLTHADLTGANLTHASLTGAGLTGANLTGADLTGAILPETRCVTCDEPERDCQCCSICDCSPCECDAENESQQILGKSDVRHHAFNAAERTQFDCARLAGVELEYNECANFAPLEKWAHAWDASIHSDGSCGWEGVTAPAAGNYLIRQIGELFTALNFAGATFDRQCGVHVHVDARDFDWTDMLRLCKVYAHVEPALFIMAGQYRMSSQWCRPVGARMKAALAVPAGHRRGELLRQLFACSDDFKGYTRERATEYHNKGRVRKKHAARYAALNIMPWLAGRKQPADGSVHTCDPDTTVEFRLHRNVAHADTANRDRLLGWVRTVVQIVEWTKDASANDVRRLPRDPFRALGVIAPECAGYHLERLRVWRSELSRTARTIEYAPGGQYTIQSRYYECEPPQPIPVTPEPTHESEGCECSECRDRQHHRYINIPISEGA